MLKQLFNYFFPQSVSGVLSSFQKVVTDLEKVANKETIKGDKAMQEADDLYWKYQDKETEADEHFAESSKAKQLADKISKTFGLTN